MTKANDRYPLAEHRSFVARSLFSLSRYEEAAEAIKESIAARPEFAPAYLWLTASYALAGRDAEARETLQRYLAFPTGTARSIAQVKRRQPFESPFLREIYDRVYQGLRKAGLPEE